MKRTLYLVFSIFLLSCGKTAEETHRVVVHSSFGNKIEGYLYSVSDKALIVDLPTSGDVIDGDTYRRTVFLDTISYLQPVDEPQTGTTIALGVVGGLFGILIGSEVDSAPTHGGIPAGPIIGLLGGAAIGIATGILLDNMEKELSPRNPEDLQYIRSLAREQPPNPMN